jgi:hypothetical protein
MSKLITALVAAVGIAGAMAVTAGPANAQWGGDWHVGGDYYSPLAYGGYGYGGYGYGGYGYGYGVGVPAAPYAIVAVPTVPAIAVPAVPAVPSYGYGYGTGYGYSSAGYGNLYSYAPGYYRRWYWQ